MKLRVFCIYDSAVESYMNPFFVNHKGEAIRGFSELANDPKSNICKYAPQFVLFELGEYDTSTAKFNMFNGPVSCGCAIEFRSPDFNETGVSIKAKSNCGVNGLNDVVV